MDLENEYNKFLNIKKEFKDATNSGDDNSLIAIEQKQEDFMSNISSYGKEHVRVYNLYKMAKEMGNSRIDISQPHETRDIPLLLQTFRECRISEFTFSSTWSDAINDCWEFIQNGCILTGMTEIFTRDGKIPAYIFKIGEK